MTIIWLLVIWPSAARKEIMEAISLDHRMIPQRLPRFLATSIQDSPYYSIVLGEGVVDAVESPEL